MVSFSFLQLIVAPLILPLLPPATVLFLTENDRPVIEQDVEANYRVTESLEQNTSQSS